jgi:hypothetical protein
MGFEPNSTNTFVGNTLTSVNMLDFQKDIIFIHSDMVSNGRDNKLQKIKANGNDFSTISYQCYDAEANSKPCNKKQNQYRFMVLQPDGDPVPLSLPIIMEGFVYQQNDSLDRFLEKASGLLDIVKYKLLKS